MGYLLALADDLDAELLLDAVREAVGDLEGEVAAGDVGSSRMPWYVAGSALTNDVIEHSELKSIEFLRISERDQPLLASVLRTVHGPTSIQLLHLGANLSVVKGGDSEWLSQSLEKLCLMLQKGHLFAGRYFCLELRRSLMLGGGEISALIADALKNLLLACDFITALRAATFNENIDALSRRGLGTDIQEFLSIARIAFDRMKQLAPGMVANVRPYSEFLSDGENLLKAANRSRWKRGQILVWLSVFFLRGAHRLASVGEGAQSIAFACRALESYCLYLLVEQENLTFDGDSATWPATGTRVNGAGELWRALKSTREGRSLPMHLVERCDEAIKLRNRSLFGHGVQNLSEKSVSSLCKEIGSTIEHIERQLPGGAERWQVLWSHSQPIDDGCLVKACLSNIQNDRGLRLKP